VRGTSLSGDSIALVRRGLLPFALACAALVIGCGNTRTKPPSLVSPTKPGGFVTMSYPGFSLQLPRSWRTSAGTAPLVTTVASGEATIAIWRYPRTQQLPHTHAQLKTALKALVEAVRARDPGFKLMHARIAPLHTSHHALELVGVESVGGATREVRSTHFFVSGDEVVVDEYAPPNLFPGADHMTFLPVVYSLRVGRGA
jgi:hypothetical protein